MRGMTSQRTPKKPVQQDWHPAQVIAELRMRAGLTLSQLSKCHGLSRQLLSFALHHAAPTSEKRIAEALGLHPMAIWPSRYTAEGESIAKRGAAGHRRPKVSTGKGAGKVNPEVGA